MLLELNVSQFAIINNLHVKFKPGFNILSGETGAGKSVLLKSLALLMGEKSSAESVRHGAEQATIEGLFDISGRPDIEERLKEQGISTDEETLVVRRLVSSQGKSKVYINGVMSTLSSLQTLVSPLIEVTGQAVPLIEMTGQHDSRHLLSKSYHLDLLDSYAQLGQLRESYSQQFRTYKHTLKEIEEIETKARAREQRADFLKYQRDEIAALGLKPGEEKELQSKYDRIKHSARLSDWASQSEEALTGEDESALVRIHRVYQRGLELRKYDPTLESKLRPLSEVKSLLDEFVFELRTYSQQIESSSETLEQLESRLSDLRKLQKKYGESAEDILKALSQIETELSELENSDQRLLDLKKLTLSLKSSLHQIAEQLHKKRVSGAEKLAASVNSELKDLNMKGVEFSLRVEALSELSNTGVSDIEFMIRPSPKDPVRPMSKIASGGELSRILLSLKNVIGIGDYPRCYLFDEVDTGVSGQTAEKVGKKLRKIAKGQQVICVTHLPQVASAADHHFYIQKSQDKKGVVMVVTELQSEERVQEIARLISGERITSTSLAHAKELLGL